MDSNTPTTPPPAPNMSGVSGEDSLSTILKVASFCIPLVGLILYFVNKENKPVSSKQACKFAIYGLVAQFVLYIIYFIIMMVAAN